MALHGPVVKVAVIGAGPAGLVAARILSRNGMIPSVYEQDTEAGGVWRYEPDDRTRPMYQGLRTNLPKEIMAYREKPWILTTESTSASSRARSFVSHGEVLRYLESYKDEFHLDRFIRYGTTVTQLTMMDGTQSALSSCSPRKEESGGHTCRHFHRHRHHLSDESWPKIQLELRSHSSSRARAAAAAAGPGPGGRENVHHHPTDDTTKTTTTTKELFDAVCICNGHFAKPSIPPIPGLKEYFTGHVMHSIEYDTPEGFAGQTVLCVGGKASGSDLAREIGRYAKRVYLSDADAKHNVEHHGILSYVPRTMEILHDSSVRFAVMNEHNPEEQNHNNHHHHHHRNNNNNNDNDNDNRCHDQQPQSPSPTPHVDTIIFCTGYDYDFPFVNADSNVDLSFFPGERRVMPLYKQLWHAHYPNLGFIGLPHSIVPFPLLELQAEAFVAQCLRMLPTEEVAVATDDNDDDDDSAPSHQFLPLRHDREQAAQQDATSCGPPKASEKGTVKDIHYLGPAQWDYCRDMAKWAGLYDDTMERYISINKAIYDHVSGERNAETPGLTDTYRGTVYVRDQESQSFRVLSHDATNAN